MNNLNNAYDWFNSISSLFRSRTDQIEKLIDAIKNELDFEKIICIETGASQDINDGCVGLFFAKLCKLTNGEFHSVDNNNNIIDKSKELYLSYNLEAK